MLWLMLKKLCFVSLYRNQRVSKQPVLERRHVYRPNQYVQPVIVPRDGPETFVKSVSVPECTLIIFLHCIKGEATEWPTLPTKPYAGIFSWGARLSTIFERQRKRGREAPERGRVWEGVSPSHTRELLHFWDWNWTIWCTLWVDFLEKIWIKK